MSRTLTLDEWAADTNRRRRLTELLDDPVFQDAARTLQSVFAETAPDIIGTNSRDSAPNAADLNNLLALRHVHRAGFFGFSNALRHLTKDRPPRVIRGVVTNFVPEDKPLPKDRRKPNQ